MSCLILYQVSSKYLMTVCWLASLFLQLRVPPQYLNIFYHRLMKKVWRPKLSWPVDSAEGGLGLGVARGHPGEVLAAVAADGDLDGVARAGRHAASAGVVVGGRPGYLASNVGQFWCKCTSCLNRFLSERALVAAFILEKALGGATNLEAVWVWACCPGNAAVALLPPDAHLENIYYLCIM